MTNASLSATERDRLFMDLLRPHLAQAWRNARKFARIREELKQLRQTLESLDRGVIVLNRAGRVRLMTGRARQSMVEFFRNPSQPDRHLPETVKRWVRQQEQLLDESDVPAPRMPLIVPKQGKRLVVRLLSEPGQSLLLVEEQPNQWEPSALQPLGLTRREAEVLTWVAQGKTNTDIASILGLSPRTVQKNLEHIFQKLGVETRTAAAARAFEVMGKAAD